MTYEPGTYVKDGVEREAKNTKQAVALTFDGYKLKKDDDSKSEDVKPASVDAPEDARPDDVTASSGDDLSSTYHF